MTEVAVEAQAARTVNLCKTYGAGQATVRALALVSSLRQQGITETSVPWVRLAEFLVLAAILGLMAASWPARRAARLDVLAAIAAE